VTVGVLDAVEVRVNVRVEVLVKVKVGKPGETALVEVLVGDDVYVFVMVEVLVVVIVLVAVRVIVDGEETDNDPEGPGELVFAGEGGEVETTVIIIKVADDAGEGVDVCIPPRVIFSLSGILVSMLTMIAGVGETMAM